MPDYRRDRYDNEYRDPPSAQLPDWLARLFLQPEEQVQMVRGPRPISAEPFLTHPVLFLAAIPPAVLSIWIGYEIGGSWAKLHPAAALFAIFLLFGTVALLAFCAGHFTRLVATDRRLLIIQGRYLLSARNIDDLPPMLLKRHRRDDGTEDAPTIDVGAVNRMLGGKEGGFVDADTILKLGKRIDQLRGRRSEEDR